MKKETQGASELPPIIKRKAAVCLFAGGSSRKFNAMLREGILPPPIYADLWSLRQLMEAVEVKHNIVSGTDADLAFDKWQAGLCQRK